MAKLLSLDAIQMQDVDDWITVGNRLQPKEGVAPDGISIGTSAVTHTASGDDDTGNFENASFSILYETDHWKNDSIYADEVAEASPSVANGQLTYYGGALNDNSANGLVSGTGAGTWVANGAYITIDLLSAKSLVALRQLNIGGLNWQITGYENEFKVEGSNLSASDGFAVLLDGTQTATKIPASGINTVDIPLQNTGSYRWVKITAINAHHTLGCFWGLLGMLSAEAVSSDNTVDAVIPFVGTKNFAPATVTVKDENGDEIIGSGKVNLAYNVNSAGWSSLVDLQTFKLINASEFASATSIKIRVQLVGDQKFTDIDLTTTNTEINILPSGVFELKKDGVLLGRIVGNNSFFDMKTTLVDSATYEIDADDRILGVSYTTTGEVTDITLTSEVTVADRRITIKDIGGNASVNNITITTEGDADIDGQDTYTISSDYGYVVLYSNGTDWFIIGQG